MNHSQWVESVTTDEPRVWPWPTCWVEWDAVYEAFDTWTEAQS